MRAIAKLMPMRALFPLALLLTLAACQTAREAAGAYQRMADKGIQIGNPGPPDAEAAPATVRDEQGQPLPSGLVGDTANRKYTAPPK